jgi:metallo-beta-lactamase family protein
MLLHTPSRADRTTIAHLDWHNEASRLALDINDALAGAPDNKARVVLIQRLREALNGA